MTGRSERRPSDPMLILFRVHTCHMPREVEPSLSDKAGNWRTASSPSDSTTFNNVSISHLRVRNPTAESVKRGAFSIRAQGWRRGAVVSGVRRMNEVNARRARLVPGWVTVFGRVYDLGM